MPSTSKDRRLSNTLSDAGFSRKMITYEQFIKELERLAETVEELKNSNKLHEDKKFRNWRNEVTSTVNQISQANYQLPCQVNIQGKGDRTILSAHL